MSYLSDRQYGLLSHRRLLVKLKNSSSITRRLNLEYTLNVHRGCVNTIWWNELGTTILSGSDDQNLIVTDPFTRQVLTKVHSGHRENIFSAKFLPETNDRRVVSCSGDGVVFHTNFDRPSTSHSVEGCFTCHGSTTTYEVRTIPHTPNLFLSCADDCTIRLYDLRTKSNCLKDHCNDDILIKSNWGITSMDINPMNSNEIVCACADSSIRLYDHRKLSTQLSSPRQYESSINGLVSYFMLSDRKEQRRSRITSVVFNQHGTEILASYSSDSVYLLNPKQLITQEQMKERLIEHRNKKQSKININETKPTPNNIQEDENKTSPIKRLRLRGDWSDTGPDSRPIQEEEQIEPTTNQSESSNEQQSTTTTTPGRDLQNFFMRRMSDILTQLVTRTTSETEQTNQETETTTTPNNTQTNETNDNDNNNDSNNNIASSPTTNSPMVQSSPSPTSVQNSTTTNNDDEDDHESNRIGIFDLIFGGSPRFHTEEEDDNDDDNDVNHMDDDDDDEDSRTSSVTTDNVHSSEHTHRRFLSTKWDRMRKRREVERVHEENLLKTIPCLGLINSYDGHRNTRTMIKEANFWSDSYVMSGSDCGHIFIWNKFNGNIIRVIQADEHVVNCVQPHPLNYPILASSGIDYNIKIFSPLAETPIDDSDRIERTVKRNYAMIEETSSTITVPATFMLRMLTSIYRLRHREGASGVDDDD
ncbi:unnamed protein product [Rotaria sp. Silwood2]|nr:unnamed protein product [Rotaria sp. Silwood2]CAF4366435.1 unnamed protein product [Rotaria sp. Silwood2]